jgi:putative hydrolase of the HAD superfamily
MPIRAVIFDMFDTLMLISRNHDFSSPSLMRMYKFLSKNGVKVTFEEFEKAYVQSRDALYAKADAKLEEPHFNVRVVETLKSLGYNHDGSSNLVSEATAEFCDEFMKFVSPDKDVEIVLRSLHRKYKLGIISNFAIPECVDKLLRDYGLEGLFDVVVVSAAVNKRKPSPEIFKNALKTLEVSASEAVFVGDTLDADVDGPKAVGIKAVYVQRRIEKTEGRSKPDVTIKSLVELPLVLQNLQIN